MIEPAESTYHVWYCKRCDQACKIQPPTIEPSCQCTSPVPSLRPTIVTQMHTPQPKRLQALTEEEGRLRGLARKGRRVRVTFEAEVAEAWISSSGSSGRRVQLIVTTPDGRRHIVDSGLPGLHIEAASDGEQG